MQNLKKNYFIKIPNELIVLYSSQKKIITFIGPLNQRSMKLKLQVLCFKTKKIMKLSNIPFLALSNNEKKKIKSFQGTTIAKLKCMILETSVLFYQKLKIIGTGYRIVSVENFGNKFIFFKLGYSHLFYFKIPAMLKFFCLKYTKLFLYGNIYDLILSTTALIKKFKKPDRYKGKGLLYDNEKILLKEGKKV